MEKCNRQSSLYKRLRFMDRIDARRLIDNSLVTNVGYQIFLDDESDKGNFCPDHWKAQQIPHWKSIKSAVTGVRISDILRFTKWLVPQIFGDINFVYQKRWMLLYLDAIQRVINTGCLVVRVTGLTTLNLIFLLAIRSL